MDQFLKHLCLFLIPVLLLELIRRRRGRRRRSSQKLPPGSLGLPLIGQSFGLLGAMRSNEAEKWLEERVRKYGPISKLRLFGKPTVFIHGPAANKFVFTSDGDSIGNKQVTSIRKILGERNILELSGEDHKRVRGALVSFLKPESLKEYVGEMEAEVRRHLRLFWEGRQTVTVLPLAKTLTFNIICSLLFGVEFGSRRDELVDHFQRMLEGMWSVPLNLPFSRFSRSLRASAQARAIAKDLIREKRLQLEQQTVSPRQDLITCLLSIRDDDNRQLVSDDEIVDNILVVMVAGHDTSSILITFMLRLFCINPAIHAAVVQEQEDIVKSKKSSGESVLTWEDLAKMKYTWKVALETLRLFPPIFGGFRNTLKDIEFGGHLIPKGWQIFWASSMTHMDANIFEEPYKFDPTRFENQLSIPPYCFVAFGGGPRICPGYEFARLETLVPIHHIVTRFTWKLCCSDDSFIRDPLPVPAQGLPIQILPKTLP